MKMWLPRQTRKESIQAFISQRQITKFPLGKWDTLPALPVGIFAVCFLVPHWLSLQGVAWSVLAAVLVLRVLSFFRNQGKVWELPGACLAVCVLAFMCQNAIVDFVCHGRLQSSPGFAPPRLDSASYAGLSVAVFYWVTVLGMRLPAPQWLVRRCARIRGPTNGSEMCLATGLLVILAMIPYFVTGGIAFLDLFVLARSEGLLFGRTGWGDDLRCMYTFWLNAWPAAVWLASYAILCTQISRRYKQILGGLMLLSIVGTLSIGSRTHAGYVFLAPLLMWIVANYRKPTVRQIVFIGIFAVVVFGIMQTQVRYRDVGWSEVSMQKSVFLELGGLDLTSEIALIFDTYPGDKPFYGGQGLLIRALRPIPDLIVLFVTNPIPRALWAGKPNDPSWGDYNYYRTGATGSGEGSNVTPSIVGRNYMRYGLIGVLEIAVLYGWLWSLATQLYKASNKSQVCNLFGSAIILYLMGSVRDLNFAHYPILILMCLMLLWPRGRPKYLRSHINQ